MRIGKAGPAGGIGRAARGSIGGARFAPALEESGEAPAAGALPPAAAALPLAMLQGARDEAAAGPTDQDAAGHGRAVLDALAGLQVAVLGGKAGPALHALADLAGSLPQAADPRLDAVLQAIAQRAAIELARLG